mgnify:CR=1 FL=1
MLHIVETYGAMLLRSLGQTILLTLLSLIFAMIVGLIFALMNVIPARIISAIYAPQFMASAMVPAESAVNRKFCIPMDLMPAGIPK